MSNPTSDVTNLAKQVDEQQKLLIAEEGKASLAEMERQELLAQQVKLNQQIDQIKRLLRQHQASFNYLDRQVSSYTQKDRQEKPMTVKRAEKERNELKERLENYRNHVAQLTAQKESQKEAAIQMEQQGIERMMTNKSHEIHLRSLQGSLVQAKYAQMQAQRS